MAKVEKQFEVSVSVEKFYQAVSDVEKYPQFLSEVVSAKIVKGKGTQSVRAAFEIEVVKKFDYVLDFKLEPQSRVSWKLVESNFFKENKGSWVITSKTAGITEVQYDLDVGFGFLVPGFISKKLTEINLPAMFKAFEKRALEL